MNDEREKRDIFAMVAMHGLISKPRYIPVQDLVDKAYMIADAMIQKSTQGADDDRPNRDRGEDSPD